MEKLFKFKPGTTTVHSLGFISPEGDNTNDANDANANANTHFTLLACGTANGIVQLWDLREKSQDRSPAIQFECRAGRVGGQGGRGGGRGTASINALTPHPTRKELLFVAAGAQILELDMRRLSLGGGSPSAAPSLSRWSSSPASSLPAGTLPQRTDDSKNSKDNNENNDNNDDDVVEINSIAVRGDFLACVNDDGQVQVHELSASSSSSASSLLSSGAIKSKQQLEDEGGPNVEESDQESDQETNEEGFLREPSFRSPPRRLQGGPHHHSSVAMDVHFRPNKPWELLTVGLDGRLQAWDFARGRRVDQVHFTQLLLQEQEQQQVEQDHPASPSSPSLSQPTTCNPPLAYSMDVTVDGRCVVVGLGNGDLAWLEKSQQSGGGQRSGRGGSFKFKDARTTFTHGHSYSVAKVYVVMVVGRTRLHLMCACLSLSIYLSISPCVSLSLTHTL